MSELRKAYQRDGGDVSEVWFGDEGGDAAAFVYLPMRADELINNLDRAQLQEYQDRKPTCVQMDRGGAIIQAVNAGLTVSDLVVLEWRVVFCTLRDHQAQEGFSVDHADDMSGDPVENLEQAGVILPGKSKDFYISWPPPNAAVVNIYLRARVSTLWSGQVDLDQLDVVGDQAATEAHLRLA